MSGFDSRQRIHQRIEAMVEQWPDRLAVKTPSETLTYGELNRRANRIAHAILEREIPDDLPVGIVIEKSAAFIAAMLGALKAGKFYVPFDPWANQVDRAVYQDSGATLLLTNPKNEALTRSLAQDEAVVLDVERLDATPSAERNPSPSGKSSTSGLAGKSPEDLALVLYTSGSTGQPKGTMQNHQNLLNDIQQVIDTGFYRLGDRAVIIPSFTFIGATTVVFAGLISGASLHPFEVREKGWKGLVRWLIDEEITLYHSTRTFYSNVVSALSAGERIPSLRLVRLAGEPVYKRDFDQYKEHFSDECRFVNLLGTTETSMIRQFIATKETEIPGTLVPAGYPVPTKEVSVVGEDGQVLPPGEVGEIIVRSRFLALGYWRKPELTAQAFLPDPSGGEDRIYRSGDVGRMRADGCLEYLGRNDARIKLGGKKIPLPEVEGALLEHPSIGEVAVTAREYRLGDDRLVAYFTARGEAPFPTELRAFLAPRLEPHMVPSVYVELESIPRGPSGKVALDQLPLPDTSRPRIREAFRAPRTALERMLAGLWSETLMVDPIGVDDRFIDLGGSSLPATLIATRVREQLEVELSIQELFDAGTIGELARLIEKKEAEKKDLDPVKKLIGQIDRLSEDEIAKLLAVAGGGAD